MDTAFQALENVLSAERPCTVCRARSFSAKKDFGALMKMMPLEVMMPTTGQLTLTLPASGAAEKSHNPFGSLISIAGIKDEVVLMPPLQRPKKVQLQSQWISVAHALCSCDWT